MKIFNKFALSYLEIIVKGQVFRISGSQFLKWLFGTFEKRATGTRLGFSLLCSSLNHMSILTTLLEKNTGSHSLYVICCISAPTILRASWKSLSSFHCGFNECNLLAIRLCSRTQITCNVDRAVNQKVRKLLVNTSHDH